MSATVIEIKQGRMGESEAKQLAEAVVGCQLSVVGGEELCGAPSVPNLEKTHPGKGWRDGAPGDIESPHIPKPGICGPPTRSDRVGPGR